MKKDCVACRHYTGNPTIYGDGHILIHHRCLGCTNISFQQDNFISSIKIKRWKWVLRDNKNGALYVSNEYFTEENSQKLRPGIVAVQKIDSTECDF